MSTAEEPRAIAKTPLRGGGAVMAIIPQDIDQVWRIAGMAVMGRMAPESLVENKEFEEARAACAIAIMAGAELGLTPLTALRSYAVVNGRPSLWGDGIKAVVRSSGKCEFIRAGGDLTKGWCEAKRKDTGEEMRREFTWEQAKKAGLSTKKGPWQDYPDMMMERRATFRCLNDLFADVLGGLSDASDPIEPDDMRDVTPPRAERVAPPPPDNQPPAPTIEAEPPAPEEPGEEAAAGEPEVGSVEWFGNLRYWLEGAGTVDKIEEVWSELDVESALSGSPEWMNKALDIKAEYVSRIELKAAGQGDMLEGLPEETRNAVRNAGTP